MRKLLILALLGYLGYTGYEVIALRQDPAYQVYLAYSQALLDNDILSVKALSGSPAALKPSVRAGLIPGKRRFVYHRLLSRQNQVDGTEVWHVRKTTRFDPPGSNTFYGKDSLTVTHTIQLKNNHGTWMVLSFEETVA